MNSHTTYTYFSKNNNQIKCCSCIGYGKKATKPKDKHFESHVFRNHFTNYILIFSTLLTLLPCLYYYIGKYIMRDYIYLETTDKTALHAKGQLSIHIKLNTSLVPILWNICLDFILRHGNLQALVLEGLQNKTKIQLPSLNI